MGCARGLSQGLASPSRLPFSLTPQQAELNRWETAGLRVLSRQGGAPRREWEVRHQDAGTRTLADAVPFWSPCRPEGVPMLGPPGLSRRRALLALQCGPRLTGQTVQGPAVPCAASSCPAPAAPWRCSAGTQDRPGFRAGTQPGGQRPQGNAVGLAFTFGLCFPLEQASSSVLFLLGVQPLDSLIYTHMYISCICTYIHILFHFVP